MNNAQARGYMILAMQAAGLDYATAKKVLDQLWWLFDTVTEVEAESRSRRALSEMESTVGLASD